MATMLDFYLHFYHFVALLCPRLLLYPVSELPSLCSANASNLERFQLRITKKELYGEQDTLVDAVLRDMIKLPIQHVGKTVCFRCNCGIVKS